jgi:hypothetical protein
MTFAEILAYGTGSWHLHRVNVTLGRDWVGMSVKTFLKAIKQIVAMMKRRSESAIPDSIGSLTDRHVSVHICGMWGSEVGFGERPSPFLPMGKFAGQRLNVVDEHRRRLQADQRRPIADHCTSLAKEGLAVNPVCHWYMFVYSPCAC